ncbi:TPA: RTX family hemolysin [Escherichia coli]|uniref:RTX family hemolysin n=1 Tax=Escherichia coli TaxID=562 RepID=UPI000DA491F0|nr:RTX family hemolysin [Escherichia coli]EEY3529624.1 RTX toxin hemolysin A [Escherichia coli]EFJ7228838.1 RTX family hemolysin [Escherichia coli]EFN7310286.1 RTX toxin hemolysin A [Escherichia coli]SQL92483.1 hemolysin A [Escherichia coli]HAW1077095.1 RTX family hemolysin [Escherichia coli]
MPNVTVSQLKASLQSTMQSSLNKVNHAGNITIQTLKSAANTAKDALTKGLTETKKTIHRLILLIPDNYTGQGESLNELIKSADTLGIEVQNQEQNPTAIANQLLDTTGKLLGVTERGVIIFAPQLDNLMQKYNKTGGGAGGNAENIGNSLGKAGGILSTIQSFIGSALAGMELDDLISRQKNGENVSQAELAEASIELINQFVETVSTINETIDTFSEDLNKLGSILSGNKYLGGLSDKLQNIPDTSKLSTGVESISSILSIISTSLILSNSDASTGTKVAAGMELTTKILGNTGKALSQYIISQRTALGLSTSAASAGLIASTVSLAISPLAFISAAENFERAQQLQEYSHRFEKFGYDGDGLLASFYHETGTIDATLTAISTVLNSISAGVSAASAASLIAAPVSVLTSAITGIITGILDASKQPMFELVADKCAEKIADWEKKYGKNYFENGYDARHAAFLEDSFNLLSSINDEYNVQKAIIITQQSWDENIGTLAGITKNGNRVQSGKVYTDFFEEGKRIESSSDEFSTQIFDPLKGNLDISDSKTSTLLKFMTPILTPGEELRTRKQSGKYEYITELQVKGVNKWTVKGVKSQGAVYDYSSLIQYATTESGQNRQIIIDSFLGEGDDKVFMSSGSSNVDAGNGYDVVYYDKTDTGYLSIDGKNATTAGYYTVTRSLGGDVKILQEIIKTQEVSVGKRTEKIQYRNYEITNSSDSTLTATDTLNSVEEIIGSNRRDYFYGSKFTDIFHGAEGDDIIEGYDGDDRLYGDNGNDTIIGGEGNDCLYGGNGNDILNGGQGNNYLRGGQGNDELQAYGTGNNILLGDKGNNKLYGSGGDDFLDGGSGDSYLNGGYGNDIYRYFFSYGVHVIEDDGGSNDKLTLSDISLSDIGLKRVGNDLILNKSIDGVLSFNENNDVNGIIFKGWFNEKSFASDNHQIEKIIDKDGKVITSMAIEDVLSANHTYISGDSLSVRENINNIVDLSKDISKIIQSVGDFNTGGDKSVSMTIDIKNPASLMLS